MTSSYIGAADASLPNLGSKELFGQFLSVLNAQNSNGEEHLLLQELCTNSPKSHFPHILAGWVFNPPEDEPYYQKAVEIAPNSALVRAAYGHHLYAYGNFTEAIEQFQIVSEQDPNHLFAHYHQLSSLAQIDPTAAETLGIELTERWPENAAIWFEYSRALRKQNKHKEQLPIIQKAVSLCTEVPHLYQRHLADSLNANEQYAESEQAFLELLTKHECERCWQAYASLLSRMGPDKTDLAEEATAKAIAIKAKQTTANKATKSIANQSMEPIAKTPVE